MCKFLVLRDLPGNTASTGGSLVYGSCWLKEELLVMKVHPSNGQSTVVAIAHNAGQVHDVMESWVCNGTVGYIGLK